MPSTDFQLLLVDDDPGAIQVMSRMLSHYPRQRFATSGEAALRLAREAVPDLILLDADMPGMSGLDVCRALKADPALERVPVIFVTSYDVPELEVEALRLGAGDYVAKPLCAAQLAACARNCAPRCARKACNATGWRPAAKRWHPATIGRAC